MKAYTYIIVGGGLAGQRACDGIRKVDTQGSIALVAAESHAPYQGQQELAEWMGVLPAPLVTGEVRHPHQLQGQPAPRQRLPVLARLGPDAGIVSHGGILAPGGSGSTEAGYRFLRSKQYSPSLPWE